MNFYILSALFTPTILLSILVLLVGTLAFLGFIYYKERQFEKQREKVFDNYEDIIAKAHAEAAVILQKATEQAKTFEHEDANLHEAITQTTEQSFQSVVNTNLNTLTTNSEVFLKEYMTSLQTLRERYQKDMEQTLQELQKTTQQEFMQYKDLIRNNMLASENSLTKQLNDSFQKTQIEISEYKRHKLQEVNTSINGLLVRIAEEVLGRAIPLADHQKLVMESLEKAQKEGLFT